MRPKVLNLALGIVAMFVCSVGVLVARQSSGADATSSLAALVHEVRLLRATLEKSTQAHTQTQALSVYLSALQNRLNQSVERMDTLRRELSGVDRMVEMCEDEFQTNERLLSSGHHAFLTAEQRATTVERQAELKTQLERYKKQQADVGAQLSEATTTTREDMARWTEMVARLDQLTRR